MADQTENTKPEIRSLRASDIRQLSGVIGQELGVLADLAGDENKDPTKVGMALFERILTKHVDALWSWLADVANMTPEELDEQPLTFPVEIVREIQRRGEFRPLLDALFSQTGKAGNGSGTE